ncbi:MAG: hypothetical protein LC676_14800 [Loktanella sp.]|nr:hypothetical protein [Loktanella sp.]
MTIETNYHTRAEIKVVLCSNLILAGFMSFASPATAQEGDVAQGQSETPDIIGEMTIDGQTYELTRAYWCASEDGFVAGTTVAIRVAALDESGDIFIRGFHVDRDEGRSSYQNVTAKDVDSTYRSGDMMLTNAKEPSISVENGVVRIRTEFRVGEAEAEFSLPDQPGFPGYC